MFPHTLTIIPDAEFLRGASGNITSASLVGGADYNMVSMLRVNDVLAWDGMTLFCEDFRQMMSNLFTIGVTQLGNPVCKHACWARFKFGALEKPIIILKISTCLTRIAVISTAD